MTKQRTAILTALRQHPGHYTADEIFALAKKEYPALSRATVYNTLSKFVRDGAVGKIMVDGTSAVYDTTTTRHAHAVCPVCGCWHDVEAPAVRDAIEKEFGRDVAFQLAVQIPCEKCKNKKI